MADSPLEEDLHAQQKKERKELLAKTQKMKHGIPKSDKKKKKEVTAEIAQMMADLDLKHEEELKEFEKKHSTVNPSKFKEDSEELNPTSISSGPDRELIGSSEQTLSTDDQEDSNTSQKLSKAKKRRDKKAQQAKEREKAIAKQEFENLSGNRFLESTEIAKKLTSRQLVVHEVPSDGNCLYKAIEHQLTILNLEKMTVKDLRESTSKYLLSHKDDYLPFLTNPDTGDVLSDDEYMKYCEDIRKTSVWGGHVEIQVLAKICGKPIEVIQAEGPSVIAGDETSSPKLIISYHKHAYGLGEHYNSVIPVNI